MTVHDYLSTLADGSCPYCGGRGWNRTLRPVARQMWNPNKPPEEKTACEWVEEVCRCVRK